MKRLRRWFDLVGEVAFLADRAVVLTQERDEAVRALKARDADYERARSLLAVADAKARAKDQTIAELHELVAKVSRDMEDYVLGGGAA